MKKTLSVILTLCMLLGLCSFSVAAAPEGTAITDAAGFAAMDPAGKYYLANDITISESYAQVFTGTLDGNGKTVTVSAPMFVNFAGTAKNFTIAGAVTVAEGHAGALANDSVGGTAVVLENIVNNASVTGSDVVGGLIGQFGAKDAANGISLTLTGCVNNATVTGVQQTGGLVGYGFFNTGNDLATEAGATFTDCVNNGAVSSTLGHTGGLLGRSAYTKNMVFTKCVNNGNICGGHNTGGIFGHATSTVTYMTYCQNNGTITNVEAPATDSVYAGGLIGYGQGTKAATLTAGDGYYANKIEFCVNTGEVTGAYRAAGIAASTGASGAYGLSHISYCINTGNVTSRGLGSSAAANAAGGILGYGAGSKTNEYAYVTNCVNTGNIESKGTEKGVASYFLGYISSKYAIVKDNIGMGTLTSACGNTYALCWNNAAEFAPENITGNSLPAGNTYPLTYENAITDKTYEIGATDAAALVSGKLVYEFNQAYKAATGATEDVLFMNINGTDFAPTLIAAEDGSNAVVKNADGTFANPEKAPEDTTPDATEPAPDTTEPGTSTPTGDSAIVFAAIAAISVLGVAVVAKRREN